MSEDFYLNKTVDEDDPALALESTIPSSSLNRMNTEESSLLNDSVSLLEDSPEEKFGKNLESTGLRDPNSPIDKSGGKKPRFSFDGVQMI